MNNVVLAGFLNFPSLNLSKHQNERISSRTILQTVDFPENLSGIKHVEFVRCKNLHDFGLEYMAQHVGGHLKSLRIEECPRITEFGLEHLNKFSALDTLVLRNLKSVHGKEKVEEKLRGALKQTDIKFEL